MSTTTMRWRTLDEARVGSISAEPLAALRQAAGWVESVMPSAAPSSTMPSQRSNSRCRRSGCNQQMSQRRRSRFKRKNAKWIRLLHLRTEQEHTQLRSLLGKGAQGATAPAAVDGPLARTSCPHLLSQVSLQKKQSQQTTETSSLSLSNRHRRKDRNGHGHSINACCW